MQYLDRNVLESVAFYFLNDSIRLRVCMNLAAQSLREEAAAHESHKRRLLSAGLRVDAAKYDTLINCYADINNGFNVILKGTLPDLDMRSEECMRHIKQRQCRRRE